MIDCPLELDKTHCQNCIFAKESLCDYPYLDRLILDEIKKITKELALKVDEDMMKLVNE